MQVDTNFEILADNFSRLKEVFFKQSFDKVSFYYILRRKINNQVFSQIKGLRENLQTVINF